MSVRTCPSCGALLSAREIGESRCQKCGSKAPSELQMEAPLSSRLRDSSGLVAAAAFRHLAWREPASRLARLAAAIIDTLLYLSLYGVVIGLGNALGAGGKTYLVDEDLLGLFLVGYGFLFLVQVGLLWARGQTVGKFLIGIRIVREEDDSSPGFLRVVLLRLFVPALIGAIPCVGPFFGLADVLSIFSEDCRCLHDYLAGTKVVST